MDATCSLNQPFYRQHFIIQSMKKAAMIQQDTARTQTMVDIKGEITRWKACGEENALGSSEDIARFLLDL